MDKFGLDESGLDDLEGEGENHETLVQNLKVMTLATSSDQGSWSVPLYYVYRNRGFYFFSSPDSRHVRDALQSNAVCGASLFADAPVRERLRGIQMQGVVESLPMTPESLAAAGAYVKKFGIQVGGGNVLTFIMGRFRAQLYRFVARESYYMNNSVGFGSRKSVIL
ncbi:MAG: pyridoxamine 5'-phosphate oxidase family protein [Desulfobacterium sp.]|nr:pyridoxamine 5'-phosphate oxidase family protein [Desulfobacterium sp.]